MRLPYLVENQTLVSIKTCIQKLSSAFQLADLISLGDATGLLFDRHLDYRGFAEGEREQKLLHDVPKTAAFVLLNQLILYDCLAHNDPQFPPLAMLTGSGLQSLRDSLAVVSKREFAPIFNLNILDYIPDKEEVISEINAVIAIIRSNPLSMSASISNFFARLIPLSIRKHIAAFYTGNVGAKILADLSIENARDRILDLACGSGTLLIAAYRRKRALLSQTPSSAHKKKCPQKLIEDILGNDVVPFAAHLAAANLFLQGYRDTFTHASITSKDGFSICSTPERSEENADGRIPLVNVVIMNPPFTRHERVSEEFTAWIQAVLRQEGYATFLAGKMSLQHYFLFHADSFIDTGSRLAFVLPANTFNVDLTGQLVAFLTQQQYQLEYLIAVNSKQGAFSEDCHYKEYLFIARKGGLSATTQTKCAIFNELPTIENLDPFLCFLREVNKNAMLEIDGITLDVKLVSTGQLYGAEKWDPVFWELQDAEILAVLATDDKLQPLATSEEFTFVTGFHSTHCDELILPNKHFRVVKDRGNEGLEIERVEDQAVVIIPLHLLRPCLRESKLYRQIYVTPRHWVLSIPREAKLPTKFVNIFLQYTTHLLQGIVRVKARKGGKVREQLDPYWYAHPHETGCDSKVGHLWTFNRYGLWRRANAAFYTDQAVTANDGFHLYDYNENAMLKEDALQILNSWFNTSIHLFDFLRKCRVPATHVQQTLKPDRASMFVPIIAQLTTAQRKTILEVSRVFYDSAIGTILEQLGQTPRAVLDKTWLQILGVKAAQTDSFLEKLYRILTRVIRLR